jgi:quercetin dioxygenase-like cupin family protein
MPVIKQQDIKLEEVKMNGVVKTTKANVVGPAQGWNENTLRVFKIGPNGFTPHHQHDWEHVNYVIKGEGTLTLSGETHHLKAGDYAFVPPNMMHQFRNTGDQDFEFICVVPQRGA